jgi:Flp pilus assembly CpaF family ATPase
MPRNIAQIENIASPFCISAPGQHHARLEAKLKREIGETILQLLADDQTEDIVLNPDSTVWVKRMGVRFQAVGKMPPTQAASALNTIAAWKGTVMNHDRPILETELPP